MHIHNIKLYNIIKNSLNDGDDFFFKLRYFISFIIYISLFSCVTSDELLKYSGSDSIMYNGLAASSGLSATDSEFKSVFRPYISQQLLTTITTMFVGVIRQTVASQLHL